MWKCKHCSEQVEDNFDICWNCGFSRDNKAPATNVKDEIKTNKDEVTYQTASGTSLPSRNLQKVVVVDVNIPFGSMVGLMVKWAIATIPAFLILYFLAVTVIELLGTLK